MAQRGGAAKITTDHNFIRRWVEQRGGCPATVRRTSRGGDPGLLRIDYPGYSGKETLKEISWDEFFDKFEDNNLAFLYQDKRDSRFSKLVARETVQARAPGDKARPRATGRRTAGALAAGRARAQRPEPQRRETSAETPRRTRVTSTGGRGARTTARTTTRTRTTRQTQRRRAK